MRLLARRGVHPHELGVDAEATARAVDRVQLAREHGVSFLECVRLGDRDDCRRPECREAS